MFIFYTYFKFIQFSVILIEQFNTTNMIYPNFILLKNVFSTYI